MFCVFCDYCVRQSLFLVNAGADAWSAHAWIRQCI